MKRRLKILLPILGALLAFAALLVGSEEAVEHAREGLSLCGRIIIPSLFPFLMLSTLLSQLGLPRYLGRLSAPLMKLLFGVGGNGTAAFVLGITGGYPIGASVVTEMYRTGQVTRDEAQRLLAFCNNSGPAFIIGAAGVGIFSSPVIGLLLYAVHICAAVAVGVLMSSGSHESGRRPGEVQAHFQASRFATAFSASVKSAASTVISICSFVVLFSVLTGVLDALGLFSAAAGSIAVYGGLELGWVRSLLAGLLEITSGIGAMDGMPATPSNLALAAFILGWGGLSVQCQALAIIEGTGLKSTRHFAGRLLHGIISALLALFLFTALGF
jgi:sporulation integral membrane protein YlbJ